MLCPLGTQHPALQMFTLDARKNGAHTDDSRSSIARERREGYSAVFPRTGVNARVTGAVGLRSHDGLFVEAG